MIDRKKFDDHVAAVGVSSVLATAGSVVALAVCSIWGFDTGVKIAATCGVLAVVSLVLCLIAQGEINNRGRK